MALNWEFAAGTGMWYFVGAEQYGNQRIHSPMEAIMAYKLPALPPVYTNVGNLVVNDVAIRVNITLANKLRVSFIDDECGEVGVNLTCSQIDKLVHMLHDAQRMLDRR